MSKITDKPNFIIEWSLRQFKHLEKNVESLDLKFIILVNWKIVTFEENFYLNEEWDSLQWNDWQKYYAIMKVLYCMGYFIPEVEKNWYISEDYCFEAHFITDFIKSQRPVSTIEETNI